MQGETVVRIRAGGNRTNPYSQEPELDWSLPTLDKPMHTLAPAEPRPSEEPVESLRNAVVSGYTLYLAADEDVTAQDRMRVRGEVYEVLGDPAGWLGGGLVLQVGRTEG